MPTMWLSPADFVTGDGGDLLIELDKGDVRPGVERAIPVGVDDGRPRCNAALDAGGAIVEAELHGHGREVVGAVRGRQNVRATGQQGARACPVAASIGVFDAGDAVKCANNTVKYLTTGKTPVGHVRRVACLWSEFASGRGGAQEIARMRARSERSRQKEGE